MRKKSQKGKFINRITRQNAKRSSTLKRFSKHIPVIQYRNISNSISHIFDTIEHNGLSRNHGESTDIWGETDLLPNAQQIHLELKHLQVNTLKQILKLTLPQLIVAPSGSFLFKQLEQVQPIIISHIDFENQNEINSDVLYYPQSPHFSPTSCLTKSSIINQNMSLFTSSFIEQKPRLVGAHSILSLISHFRQNNLTGITLEQWIINYLFEQMFIKEEERKFTHDEIIFETVLPNTQSCILVSFDENKTPNIFPLSKFDILTPSQRYRQVVNF